MSKHTPGPWRYKIRDLVINNRPVMGAIVTKVSRGSTKIVAELTGQSSEANARLIAAAPEILETLYLIANHGLDAKQCMEAARAAIAKATGETQ